MIAQMVVLENYVDSELRPEKAAKYQAPNYLINVLTCLQERHQGLSSTGESKRLVMLLPRKKKLCCQISQCDRSIHVEQYPK